MSKILRFTATLMSIFFLVTAVSQVSAQTVGSGMTIIPPKFELFGNPGDQITDTIRVRNDSLTPVTYTVVVEDFSSTGEEGQVVLEEGQESKTNFSLASWIQTQTKEIALQPNEELPIFFTITIPKDGEPGGHYASILFQTGGETIPGAASVSQRVGSLILLRVSGNVTENALIETFEAPSYTQSSPLNVTLRLKNEGNTHIRPKGTVVITNMFGQKIDELTLNGQNVLPGATRKMDTEWKRPNLLGVYTATMVATYGQQNLPLTAATKFVVMSPTAIALITIGVIAGILFIFSLISGRSRLLKALGVIISGK